jgi:6,7-dimethyl-8-ribityllumazine synthase
MNNDKPEGLPSLKELELAENTKILIVKASYNGPEDELLNAFEAAKSLCDELSVQYDVKLVPGSLELAPAIAIYDDTYHGYVALGAILPSEKSKGEHTPEQKANIPVATQLLALLNTQNKLCIGTAIISHLIDRTPEQWGINAVDACLRLAAIKQEKLALAKAADITP